MIEAGLQIINDSLKSVGINYAFMEWKGKPVYPYFVGEYQEIEPPDESGLQETNFILDGFTRGRWEELEQAKNKIKSLFPKVVGKVVIAEDGSAVAIFYANSLVVPTGDAELKKIQINLVIKEWSVN